MFNLSREYQLMGALLVSNELAHRAVESTAQTHFGSYQYYLAIAQRSHVSAELGYATQALKDLEEIRCSTIPEMAPIALDLETVLNRAGITLPNRTSQTLSSPVDGTHESTPSWRERVEGSNEAEPLTELEDQFLKVLLDGAVDRWTMMRKLYGNNAEHRPLVYENRLKQLAYRLRKKRADLFTYRQGQFMLIDAARA